MPPNNQPPQARAATKKHVILFLAANPPGTGRLSLDDEARSIHVELKRSGHRDRFDFVTRWAAQPLDLLHEIRELKPTVVHFSGHGGEGAKRAESESRGRDVVAGSPQPDSNPHGLYFHDGKGGVKPVSPEAIAQTLDAAGASIKLVVLNACFTASIADALLAHVDFVVGMAGSIHDDTARIFATGFYGALGDHESIAAAFKQGQAAISLEGFTDAERPQLKARGKADAAELILAAVAPTLRLDVPCPYPGMRPYTPDDARFHGRDSEIQELIRRLQAGEREIYVIGPSGSGKSSLVAAGVLPRLARGVTGLGPVVVRDLRPGERPLTRLRQALDVPPDQPLAVTKRIAALLAHRAPGASVLIVIDQFEELFTLASARERAPFLAAVRALRAEPRCAVILTLRADFSGALMESSLWPEHPAPLLRIDVSPLRGAALRDAISAPAAAVGVEVEPELIERLLADAASEPGILPLLQETMVQLWDQRTDQMLTLADYQALGDGNRSGLAVALARRADATLRRYTPAQAAIARRVLLRLVSFGEGRSDTRRQQPRAQLQAVSDETADFMHVLQTMIDHRLLTIDEDADGGEPRIDLAHEVLISAWPTLASWVRSHRVDEQRRRDLEEAAIKWVMRRRGVRGLLDSNELADAEAWQKTESALELGRSAEVTEFITASRAEQTRQRRRRQGLIWGAFGVLTSFAAVVAALAIAYSNQADNAVREADRASREADHAGREADHASREATHARQLLAQSYAEEGRRLLLDRRYQEAIPFLLEARRKGEDGKPLQMMFKVVSRQLPLVPLEHQDRVTSAAFSPDGTRVVTASWDHSARVWDAATGTPITSLLHHQGRVVGAAFNPCGTRVVTASWDGTARIWDAATGKPITTPLRHQGRVWSAVFSPDGSRVVTTSDDQTAQLWDAATSKPLTSPLKHQDWVRKAAFSRDGTRVVTASGDMTARVWDAATGNPITSPLRHHGQVWSAEFSPDGTRVITASWDKTARIWDAATGMPLTRAFVHDDKVLSAAFSPDGTRVVTASDDGTARVWDAATGKPLTSPLRHQGLVASAQFSPDGTRVVTASSDRTARVWDAATGKPLTSVLDHDDKVVSAAFSPDGTRIVTASNDRVARVWDAATGKPPDPLPHQDKVVSAAFSPGGMRVVTVSDDKAARVWDAATGKPLTGPLRHRCEVRSAAFSPDGSRVVTASEDQTARVWDAATGKQLTAPLQHRSPVVSAAFNIHGTRVITVSDDGTLRVWDASTGKQLTGSLASPGPVVGEAPCAVGIHVLHSSADVQTSRAAFSPDGTRVVTVNGEHGARVWDVATGKPLTGPLEHQGLVVSAAFSPDGTRVVTASWDTTARVWDAASGKLLTAPLQEMGLIWSAVFSPDGTRIVTASADRTARVWDAITGKPLTGPLEHQGPVVSAAFSPDGTRVVTASHDKTARIWDATTGKPLTSPFEHQDSVVSAVFSPDGTRVVTASDDKTARIWEVGFDEGTLEDWSTFARRSPFVLSDSALVRRSALLPDPGLAD